ncbi:hypothetical protein L2Y54_11995 [Thiothrix winogradskyi]|uniref:Uncharacterized protein n=1 Tax=Thiothrix winogradskyi TaxID=96472 RepID=A0ABY3ST17_9GAMM|nr:hypothetical protein [Thiothrix winogradskyi]UJS22667.1 hypothetical protein L2Y54_11995 [Thiothrix winogradskyi]
MVEINIGVTEVDKVLLKEILSNEVIGKIMLSMNEAIGPDTHKYDIAFSTAVGFFSLARNIPDAIPYILIQMTINQYIFLNVIHSSEFDKRGFCASTRMKSLVVLPMFPSGAITVIAIMKNKSQPPIPFGEQQFPPILK